VAVFHVFQEDLFDMENVNYIQVELIKLLAEAINLRVTAFYPTSNYYFLNASRTATTFCSN